jgi:hypothetical protein
MKRIAFILLIAVCGNACAAWQDPNTNANWGVYPVQAHANGVLASPANFFEANKHSISGIFSNRGAMVNGYVWRFEYDATNFNTWICVDDDPVTYELEGQPLRLVNGPDFLDMSGIQLEDTNAYIEINTAYDAAIGFSRIDIEATPGTQLRTFADAYEPATTAPFGTHINRLYIRPVTTGIVKKITIYGFETNTYIGTTNDFAGITLRIDDPVSALSPVNLRSMNSMATNITELAKQGAIAAATNSISSWYLFPAQSITLSNGWKISTTNSQVFELKAGTQSVFSASQSGSVSVPGTLTVGPSTVSNLDFAPLSYTGLLPRIVALEGKYLDYTGATDIALIDGSRAISELYVGATNDAIEQLTLSRDHSFAYTGACNVAQDTQSSYLPNTSIAATGSLCELGTVDIWAYELYRFPSGNNYLAPTITVNPTAFFGLNTFFYQAGRFILNPNLTGSIALTNTIFTVTDENMFTYCATNSGDIRHTATGRIVLAMGSVQVGRLYQVSFDALNVGPSVSSMIVSFGGVTNVYTTGRRVKGFYYTRTTNNLVITAATDASALEIDNVSILLFSTNHHAYISGNVNLCGSIDLQGHLSAGSLQQNGTPITNLFPTLNAYDATNNWVKTQLDSKVSINAFAQTSNGLTTAIGIASNALNNKIIAASNGLSFAIGQATNTLRNEVYVLRDDLKNDIAVASNALRSSIQNFDLSNYNRRRDVFPSGLVSHWDFNEGYGDIVHDSHTNAARLTGNSPTWGFTNAAQNYRRNYAAFSFDGSYFSASHSNTTSLKGDSGFTVTSWFCLTSSTPNVAVLIRGPLNGNASANPPDYQYNASWGISQYGTDVFVQVGTTGFVYKTPPGWHFFALKYVPPSAETYCDGALVGTQLVTAFWWGYPTNVFCIGGNPSDPSISSRALIDDVMFFNRGISSNEMQALRTEQMRGDSGLHWYYP